MAHSPVRQWGFQCERGVLPPAQTVSLVHGEGAVPVREVTALRRGSSPEVVRFGERLALAVDGGLLRAGPAGGPALVVSPGPDGLRSAWQGAGDRAGLDAREWEIVGGRWGTAVAAGVPVALFNHVVGDHLVASPGSAAEAGPHSLGWWCGMSGAGGQDPFAGMPPLPLPAELRAVGADPAQAEVGGVLETTGGSCVLRLDAPVRTRLLQHLRDRPGARLAPWQSALGDVLPALLEVRGAGDQDALPPSGVWVVACGALVLDERSGRVVVDPLDGLAWASDATGAPVRCGPGAADWPALALTWRVSGFAAPVDGRLYTAVPRAVTWLLPLPGRAGEPASTMTFNLVPRVAERTRAGAAPGLVRHPRTGERLLRLGAGPPGDPSGTARETACAVRVHPAPSAGPPA